MKTPEQMAEEFADSEGSGNETYEHGLCQGFLAGYTAAKDHYFQMIQDLQATVVELKQELKKTK